MKNIYASFCFLLLCAASFAQDENSTNENTKPGRYSSFLINFSTVPTQAINGADTTFLNSFSIAPILDIRAKSGWGLSYSPGFVVAAGKSGLYMHTFSGGFERYGKGKMDIAFSYNHFITTNKTDVPYSPISNEVFFYSSYTRSWIHPVLSASFGFGRDSSNASDKTATEFGVQAGVNHSFDWEETGPFSSMEITPGLILNAGNNQYFSFLTASKYLSHSRHLMKQKKKVNGNKKENTSSSPISLSNLELNTQISLEAGRFSLQPEGSIFIPFGNDHTIYGYWQVGLAYHF